MPCAELAWSLLPLKVLLMQRRLSPRSEYVTDACFGKLADELAPAIAD